MTTSETRYALLARLAWELRATRTTSQLVVPAHGEPTLWVMGTDRRDAVLATQCQNRWLLLWRGTEMDADRLPAVAQAIAAAVGA
ncbi:MAG: hypothetical protein JWN52_5961 [Actinomycetia bacterium]|nr:hypothetical protein [Actinomycetes bacterium]